jgi:hypothetical protein
MNIILTKGLAYNAEFTSVDFPVLDVNWSGSVSLYTTYPGVATLTKPMTLVGNKLTLLLTIAEILNLNAGVYSFVSTITNSVIGLTATELVYATVLEVPVFNEPMCKLFMTLGKSDGGASGEATKTLVNIAGGTTVVSGWKGVTLTVENPAADAISGKIVGTEKTTTTTNQAGYAEKYVIKGMTVSAACSSFGKTVVIDTTGLDSVDLSTYF